MGIWGISGVIEQWGCRKSRSRGGRRVPEGLGVIVPWVVWGLPTQEGVRDR